MAPLNRFNQMRQIDNHINQRVESESRQINTYQLIQQAGQLISSVQGFAQPIINNPNAAELTSDQVNKRNEFNNKINSTLAELEQNNSDGKLNSLIQGLKGAQSALNEGIDNAINKNKAKADTEKETRLNELNQQAIKLISGTQSFAQAIINNPNIVGLTSAQESQRNNFYSSINSMISQLEQNNSDGRFNSVIQGLKSAQSALNGIYSAINKNKTRAAEAEKAKEVFNQLNQQAGQLISAVQSFAQPIINNTNAAELTSDQVNKRNEFNNKINSTLAELEKNNSDGKFNSLIQGLKGAQSALNEGIDNTISRNKAKVKTEETTETTNTTNTTDTAETTETTENTENTENNTAPTVSEENVNNAPPTDTKPEPAAQPSENTNYASKEEAVEKMRLRQTSCKGVYCERHNPNKDKNDYTEQRHFVWNDVKKQMEEISGVYFINYNGTAKNGEIIKNSVLQAHLQNYNFTSTSGVYEKGGKNYTYNAETNSFEETTINPSDENTNPQTEITENTEVPVHNEEGTGDIDELDPPEGEVLGEKEAEITVNNVEGTDDIDSDNGDSAVNDTYHKLHEFVDKKLNEKRDDLIKAYQIDENDWNIIAERVHQLSERLARNNSIEMIAEIDISGFLSIANGELKNLPNHINWVIEKIRDGNYQTIEDIKPFMKKNGVSVSISASDKEYTVNIQYKDGNINETVSIQINDETSAFLVNAGLISEESSSTQAPRVRTRGAANPEPDAEPEPEPEPTPSPEPTPNVTAFGNYTFEEVTTKDEDGDDRTMFHYTDGNGKEGYIPPYIYYNKIVNAENNDEINNYLQALGYENVNGGQSSTQVEYYSNNQPKRETETNPDGSKTVTEYYEDSSQGKRGVKSYTNYDSEGNIISTVEYDEDGFKIEEDDTVGDTDANDTVTSEPDDIENNPWDDTVRPSDEWAEETLQQTLHSGGVDELAPAEDEDNVTPPADSNPEETAIPSENNTTQKVITDAKGNNIGMIYYNTDGTVEHVEVMLPDGTKQTTYGDGSVLIEQVFGNTGIVCKYTMVNGQRVLLSAIAPDGSDKTDYVQGLLTQQASAKSILTAVTNGEYGTYASFDRNRFINDMVNYGGYELITLDKLSNQQVYDILVKNQGSSFDDIVKKLQSANYNAGGTGRSGSSGSGGYGQTGGQSFGLGDQGFNDVFGNTSYSSGYHLDFTGQWVSNSNPFGGGAVHYGGGGGIAHY